jgi:hypothetical protein
MVQVKRFLRRTTGHFICSDLDATPHEFQTLLN